MDTNPCTEMVTEDQSSDLYAALALMAIMGGDEDAAVEWLRRIPRSRRGRLNRGLDDLSIKLSRLGN